VNFEYALETLQEQDRLRCLTISSGRDFTSFDYLGLGGSSHLRQAAIHSLELGTPLGAGGSRLLNGHRSEHEALENFAAEFFNCEKTLFMNSGYMANFALLTTLPSRHDCIIFDEKVHASIKEGAHASNAKWSKIAHNDLDDLEEKLRRARADGSKGIWLVVESLYSMDGDKASLEELHALARDYDAYLIVDEAHATGVYGQHGAGLTEGLSREKMITVHTCGKTLAASGCLIAAPAKIIDYMINHSRPFIYTTGTSPLIASVVKEALQWVQQAGDKREQLQELVKFTCETLGGIVPVPKDLSPILPVILGEDGHAVGVAKKLQAAGFDVRAIRPPTVPEGSARLRLSMTLNVNSQDVTDFADALKEAL